MAIELNVADVVAGRVTESALRVWAGRGTGKPCERCGKAIAAEDIQYDLEVTEALAAATRIPGGRTLSFHLHCYDLWRADLEETPSDHTGRG